MLLAVACGGGSTPAADLASDADAATRDADAVAPDADTFVARPNPKNVSMFDEERVVAFALAFPEGEWDRFQAFRATGTKEYVHCAFTFEGQTFADAACRSKSNPDYWAEEKKPQFVVRFNHWDKTGRFRGLRALNLEANPFHSAPIRDRLGLWLFREAGLPASRANHATVTVDGQPFGLYINIEVVDREFLEDHFPDPSGNLYENGSELITNESTPDLSRLWDLEELVDDEPDTGDHAAFFAALPGLMDVPQVLREMAAEAVLPTGDNFTNGGTNYLLYDHPGRGFLVIPWDLDDILCEYADPESNPFEYWGHPELELPPSKLRVLINANPAWKAAYVAHLKAFRDDLLPRLQSRVATVCDQVRPYVEADPYKASSDMEDFDADCEEAADRVRQRKAYLESEGVLP